jgi:hypothetical protein
MPRAAVRTGKLVRYNGQDVQNLFVGTRVVVNFRVARHPPTVIGRIVLAVQRTKYAHLEGARRR